MWVDQNKSMKIIEKRIKMGQSLKIVVFQDKPAKSCLAKIAVATILIDVMLLNRR
ncbi:hypothetical protein LFAB_12925 [Lactiplantibacillus fabifermentans T30PCM01]|uniref:Uncharacterized protein n=1 Tax=Lactiplantibacillus fabifermentans T30PCM01 TaxID=1400520 RepID=W6T5F5_9LACO|nr:hypothetical protein LFAB_12925 [Lactiplantibacillus fabifermentans T30PCM01]